MEGMHTIIVGSLDSLGAEVRRYRNTWEQYQGTGALTIQETHPRSASWSTW